MKTLTTIKNKLLSREALEMKLAEWRSAGETIVFTNGCFDILHRGHVEYLAQAADLGDKLIIGLNTDASVKRLKGESRPINDENQGLCYFRRYNLLMLSFSLTKIRLTN